MLITQPLSEDGLVSNEDVKKKIYEKIIKIKLFPYWQTIPNL